MDSEEVRIEATEVTEDRFSRFRLIRWWDQERIRRARVLVVGAGALGNEIVKNLALLGFRRVLVVDMDRVEESNLSRSVLFRREDVGRLKAEAAVEGARRLYGEMEARALGENIRTGVGLGVFDWADLIVGGLDNREARLWINRGAWLLGKAWIDGAIEGLNGVARVFEAGAAPCYECTLGAVDWQILNRRLSCNLLTREEKEEGRVPTTPTVASVIAGIETQEALKLLHGLPVLSGAGYIFEGLHHSSYVTRYTAKEDCMSHYQLERVLRLGEKGSELTLEELRRRASAELGGEAAIEFSREVIWKLRCERCGEEEEIWAALGSVRKEHAVCGRDGAARALIPVHGYSGVDAYGGRRLNELGLPGFDVFTARRGEEEMGLLVGGDEGMVMGWLAREGEA